VIYYHAAVGFPLKETFLDAVRTGNYATWPGLTTQLINKHFPDSNETQQRHMKGQRQRVQSTRQKALEYIVAKEQHITIEPGTENAPRSHKEPFGMKLGLIFDTSSHSRPMP
jgi:hypothetical protein